MAVTSIWPRSGRVDQLIDYARNPEKTTEISADSVAALHAIDGVIQYTVNDVKTKKRAYVSCLNCTSEDLAAEEFLQTKTLWENKPGSIKTSGRLCYHAYQSFKPGEVDADTAHKIGIALAEELWGDRFQVVVATHLNTNHIHNHFVINSVSNIDGRKFHSGAKDLTLLRETSDRLCKEHQLSVIKNPSGKSKHYAQWSAEKNGKPTYQSITKADIDRAVMASTTMRDFYRVMEQMGYQLKLHTKSGGLLKHPVAIPPGGTKGVRLDRLGYDYTLDGITDRILRNMRKQAPFPEVEKQHRGKYRLRGSFRKYPKATGFRALYLYYCYLLKIIVKKPASVKKVPASLREDIVKLDWIIAQTRFLGANKIETAEDLQAKQKEIRVQMEKLTQQRRDLRIALKRAQRQDDPAQVDALKAQIAALSAEVRKHRKEVKLCDDIAQRSGVVKENMEQIIRQQNTQGKESKQHEYDYRRSRTNRANVPGWR